MDTSIATNVRVRRWRRSSTTPPGTLDMNGDSVSGNEAVFGAGILTLAAAHLTGVTVAGNGGARDGGGGGI